MAKRVNSRFVYFLFGISVVVGVMAVALFFYQRSKAGNSKKWAADGDTAYQEGNFQKAINCYVGALGTDPDNTQVLLKLGTASERLTPKGREYLIKAMTAWNKAVSVDPRCTEALEKLLAVYTDQERVNPHPELYDQIKTVCDKILAIRPEDRLASEWKQVATINQWLTSQSTSTEEVHDSIDNKIPALLKKYPDSGDLLKALTDARAEQAKELVATQELDRAGKILRDALETIDAARKSQENSESVQFRAFQAYNSLRRVDPDAKAKAKEYDQRMDAAIDAAVTLVTGTSVKGVKGADPAKEDPLRDEVMATVEGWAIRRGSPAKAEQMARDFYNAHPDDPRARLDLARVLERKQFLDKPQEERNEDQIQARDEALVILGKEFALREDLGGVQYEIQYGIKGRIMEEAIRLQLEQYGAMSSKNAARRKRIAEQMDKGMADLRRFYASRNVPDPESVYDLEGQIHLAKGEDVEAVLSFQKAAAPANASGVNYELLYRLADAYRRTGQPGLARQRLEQIIAKQDDWVQPRLMLLQIAIRGNDLATAKEQLAKLQSLAPESPEVKDALSQFADAVALMGHANDDGHDVSDEAYRKMKENDKDARMMKARVARTIDKPDEAVRLYQDVLKAEPGEVQASLNLAEVYANSLGRKETAQRVLTEALRARPNDPSLVMADSRLRDDLPEVVYEKTLKAVEKTSDPFTREMQMFELESAPSGHAERAFGHLLEAYKLKSDDQQVMNRVFNYYLVHGEFDKAAPLLEKLVALNADQCGGLMYRYRFTRAKGDLPGAEEIARQLTRRYADFAASWLVLGQVLQERNTLEGARDAYLEVLKRQPQQYDAYQGLVDCFYKMNQPELAKLRLQEARKLFPDDLRIREMLLNHYVNYGEAEKAVKEREKILETDTRRQRDTADHYLSLAKAYFHAAQDVAPDRPKDAADELNKAFKTLATGKDKFPLEPRFYSQLAEMCQYNRDLKQGEAVLKEYYDRPEFKQDPQPPELLYEFYFRANKLGLAHYYLNEALVRAEAKTDPTSVDLRLRLAALCALEKKFGDAYAALDGVPAALRNSPQIARQRIELKIAEGKRAEARKDIEAELAKSDTPDLNNLMATLLIDGHQLNEAMARLAHVLAVDPTNSAAIYLQALATADGGKINEAINQLVGLRNREPSNSQVRLLLAELYDKNGNPAAAIRELDDALKKLPINRDIRLNLIRLYRAQDPVTNQSMDAILNLCRRAEADPVLGSDPEWPRLTAEAFALKNPPNKLAAIEQYRFAIRLSFDDVDYRRQFIDMLLRFQDWLSVMVESDRLLKEGHNEWWIHVQRGVALAKQDQKPRAIEEFDKALALVDKQTQFAQAENILRVMGSTVDMSEALDRVMPLVSSDPEGHWRLLQASILRAMNKFDAADQIATALLNEPGAQAPERRVPILRLKSDLWENRPRIEKLDNDKAIAAYIKARDAYAELLKYLPEDMNLLNNMAYLLAEQIPEPEGGPKKAKEYSEKAYHLAHFRQVPSVQILDTHAWVLVLCGGDDAVKGQKILEDIMTKRQDTAGFVEGRYHLGVAYLRAAKPNPAAAQKWLQEAMDLIAREEKNGVPVDPILKDRVQSALAKASGPVTTTN